MASTDSNESKVHWESNSKDQEIQMPDGVTGDGGKWESPTYTSSDEETNSTSIETKPMTAAEEYAAIAAGLAGVLAISASKNSSSESKPTVAEGNGIWVPESDRAAVTEMINRAASKEYYIDANGFVKEVPGAVENPSKSSTYSSVLDRLIGGDNKVVIGVGDGWVSSGENGLEANAFTGNNSGITIGDNGTPQVVVVTGQDTAESSADMTLAHELTHALRGEEGIKSIDTDGGINKDEEASTIEVENKIRTELGYAVRKDGDSSDGGDGSYGKYSDSSDEDWYNKIDEMQGTVTLSGNAYSNSIGEVIAVAAAVAVAIYCGSSSSSSDSGDDDDDDDCDCDCVWGSSYDTSIWSSVVGAVSNVVNSSDDWNNDSNSKAKWNWSTFFRSNADTKKTLGGINTTLSNLGASILGLFAPIASAAVVPAMQLIKSLFSSGSYVGQDDYKNTYVVQDINAYINDKYGADSAQSAKFTQLGVTSLLQEDMEPDASNCSLTALTMLATYWRDYYGYNNIPNSSSDIYKTVRDIGTEYLYQPRGLLNGTMPYAIDNIAEDSFSNFDYCVTTDNKYLPTFNDFKQEIDNGYPFLFNITSGAYKNHTVLVKGYVTTDKGNFLVVNNNWNRKTTYIDWNEFNSLCSMTTVEYGEGWKENSNGWCYKEGNSFATGWKSINGKTYYFNSDGDLVYNTEIDGYYINSNGVRVD